MSYRVQIKKISENSGSLKPSELFKGHAPSLPKVGSSFLVMGKEKMFQTSVVMKIAYSQNTTVITTMNSQYVLDILSLD